MGWIALYSWLQITLTQHSRQAKMYLLSLVFVLADAIFEVMVMMQIPRRKLLCLWQLMYDEVHHLELGGTDCFG